MGVRRPGTFRTSRRDLLRLGGLCGLGLGTAPASPVPSSRSPGFGRADSVVVVFANGGMSQIDTFDPKPDAPAEVRGAFASIATALPGVRFCEHLPGLAGRADRFTVVRSMSHDDTDHGSAVYLALTGRYHPRKSSNPPPSPNDLPTLGAALRRVRMSEPLPYTSVLVNGPAQVPELPAPGQDGGLLGRDYDPLLVGDVTLGPNYLPSLSLPPGLEPDRVASRRALLGTIDGLRRRLAAASLTDMDGLYGQAYRVLETPRCREAFDLSAEPEDLRDRYGRHRAGQACLLARRLVEAGVPLITVLWNHSGRGQDRTPDDPDTLGWDTHNDIFDVMGRHLLPRFDRTLSALLDDLGSRGLLARTLVLVLGEFGPPRVALEARFDGSSPGRKHWANVYSILAAGAGVSRGAVLGASDRIGGAPTTERFGPWDVAATIASALGIDPATEYRDALSRPYPLTAGRPIDGLYGG